MVWKAAVWEAYYIMRCLGQFTDLSKCVMICGKSVTLDGWRCWSYDFMIFFSWKMQGWKRKQDVFEDYQQCCPCLEIHCILTSTCYFSLNVYTLCCWSTVIITWDKCFDIFVLVFSIWIGIDKARDREIESCCGAQNKKRCLCVTWAQCDNDSCANAPSLSNPVHLANSLIYLMVHKKCPHCLTLNLTNSN